MSRCQSTVRGSPRDLERAASEGRLELGLDQTALVQEYIPARGGHITRVEVLDGRFLYAINVHTTNESFNLCPVDICQTSDGVALDRGACPADAPKNNLRVEAFTPPAEVIADVETITAAAGIEIGGVEYIVDDRDGQRLPRFVEQAAFARSATASLAEALAEAGVS